MFAFLVCFGSNALMKGPLFILKFSVQVLPIPPQKRFFSLPHDNVSFLESPASLLKVWNEIETLQVL